jgi:hypothetical protein
MIFKLYLSHRIYIHSEDDGEILLPCTSENEGLFKLEDYEKNYVVNGEPDSSIHNQTLPVQPTTLGIPQSYQSPRPRFSTNPKKVGWKKSFIVAKVSNDGTVSEKFQVHLTVNEEIASVNGGL